MKDKKAKLDDLEASRTLGRAVVVSRGEGSGERVDATRLSASDTQGYINLAEVAKLAVGWRVQMCASHPECEHPCDDVQW